MLNATNICSLGNERIKLGAAVKIPKKRSRKYLDQHKLCKWNHTKFLGITIDSQLTWKPHCSDLISKLNSCCYQIRVLRTIIDLDFLMSFYYAQIESRISYGICFWGSGTMLNEVFILQKRIIRCLAKIDNRTSCKEYFSSLNILTVYGLYALQILELIHVNISDFVFNGDFHTYPTRSRNKLSIPLHHFATVGKTHQVFGLKMYNSLSGNVKAVRGIFAR